VNRFAAVLTGILLAIPPVATAGEFEQKRGGFAIGLGLGVGVNHLKCVYCSPAHSGKSAYVRLGGYLRQDLFIGLEFTGYADRVRSRRYRDTFGSVALQWYPDAGSGFYLKGNLGYGRAVVTFEDPREETSVRGRAIGFGLGVDLRVRRDLSLTPFVNLMTTGKNAMKFNGEPDGFKGSFSLLQVGIGITWH
jgi:hypothetical protein